MKFGTLLMPSHPPERAIREGQPWDLDELGRLDALGHLLPFHSPAELAHRVAYLDHLTDEQRKEVAKTIKEQLWKILNAIVLKVSNGLAEGLNSRIKMIKVRSRGFRNKERFTNTIYFHLGGLDLYPEGVVR